MNVIAWKCSTFSTDISFSLSPSYKGTGLLKLSRLQRLIFALKITFLPNYLLTFLPIYLLPLITHLPLYLFTQLPIYSLPPYPFTSFPLGGIEGGFSSFPIYFFPLGGIERGFTSLPIYLSPLVESKGALPPYPFTFPPWGNRKGLYLLTHLLLSPLGESKGALPPYPFTLPPWGNRKGLYPIISKGLLSLWQATKKDPHFCESFSLFQFIQISIILLEQVFHLPKGTHDHVGSLIHHNLHDLYTDKSRFFLHYLDEDLLLLHYKNQPVHL